MRKYFQVNCSKKQLPFDQFNTSQWKLSIQDLLPISLVQYNNMISNFYGFTVIILRSFTCFFSTHNKNRTSDLSYKTYRSHEEMLKSNLSLSFNRFVKKILLMANSITNNSNQFANILFYRNVFIFTSLYRIILNKKIKNYFMIMCKVHL